jgi:hypothetical protein
MCVCVCNKVKEERGYWKLEQEAVDRTLWAARFGRGFGSVVRQTIAGAPTIFRWVRAEGKGADPEAIYNWKIMLQNHVVGTT